MITRDRRRYIPKNSVPIEDESIPAVVYLYESIAGKPCAIGYGGKRSKADFHSQFVNEKHRDDYALQYIEKLRAAKEYKAKRKRERDEYIHDYKIGDILHGSWGYDQTQCEYYQVVETTKKSVKIREICQERVPGSEGFMCESRLPIKDKFSNDKILTRRVRPGGYVSLHRSCSLSRWSGNPGYCSWYH